MQTLTPCPACGSTRLDISVKTEAIQRITLHTPDATVSDVYTYSIAHEEVMDLDITSAFCLSCPYEWVIEPAVQIPLTDFTDEEPI